MKSYYSIVILIFTFQLRAPVFISAQNAPITTLTTVANAVPGPVNVPVTVINFTNIGAISLTFDYDYSCLHFTSGVPNPLLPGFSISDNNLGNGFHRVIMGWYGSGISFPNGTAIMTIHFNYISGIGTMNWVDSGPSCEYADGNYNVLNDIPASTYYINGYVCGLIASPGAITGSTSVCKGQTGVTYSVNPMNNVTGYNWSVPPGGTIVSGNNTNVISVDFALNASSGNVTVNGVNACGNGPSSTLAVTLNPLPVANAGNDFTIPYGTSTTLYAASGGTGSFSYHWSPEALLVNPDLQNPQTVLLFNTTVFKVLVTNLTTLCQDSDEVIVTISGGPLSVNPTAVPPAICSGDTSQLYSNAGGGSGNYTYSWTCTPPGSPPWTSTLANPKVNPDSTKTYHLTVLDGFSTITGSTLLTVHQLPTATISGGDTLCGEGVTTTLTIALTGTPPWSFSYTNGLTTYTVTNQNSTPYLIVTSDPGTYYILSVADINCTGTTFGTAVVAVFPIPPTPVISQSGTAVISTGCCGNQWYQDHVLIPGATGQSYTPSVTAHYCDIVTLNGCASDTSNDIYFVMTNVDRRIKNNLSVTPNPAKNHVLLKSAAPFPRSVLIKFYTIDGRVIRTYNLHQSGQDDKILIGLEDISPGLYFLKINANLTETILKLVVQ
jgi:hypothetical protein